MVDYSKKVVELSADITTIWKLQCQNLYNSKNLGALAVRECIQNSLDAIASAKRKGQITKGRIDINIQGDDLIISDNGIGMDIKTLHNKFLNLGGTTKGDADNVGGFGLAKAVILGCGDGFKVETQDNIFTSEDLGKNPIQKKEWEQGTRITLYNVQTDRDTTVSNDPRAFKYAILDYIQSSDTKGVPVYVNDYRYTSFFTSSAKTRRTLAQFGISSTMVPRDTKLRIDVYKTDDVHAQKWLYVRLRGLTQFRYYLGWNANCNIVVDFQTKIDPRSVDYPFSTNREGLKAQYQGIIDAIRDTVAKSPLSISSEDEYKEVLFDNSSDNAEQSRVILSSMTSKSLVQVAANVSKAVDGMIPQGGVAAPSLADQINQQNEHIAEMAAEKGVTVKQYLESMSSEVVSENPLQYSWIIWKGIDTQYKRVNSTKLVEFTVVWDSILTLMAKNWSGMDGKVFYPGVVMKHDVLGLCVSKTVSGSSRTYIMFNPFETPAGDDTQTALYLMGIAAHELAHFACSAYEAHGETWAYTREAIMNANLTQLANVVKIVKTSKLRKMIDKITTTTTTKASDNSVDYSKVSLEDIIDLAEQYGLDIQEYREKYPNTSIFRMRLVMAIKKSNEEVYGRVLQFKR